MRLLGKARSDHDCMYCCPGHDPGINQGRHHRPKVRGRRAQRAREKAAFRRRAEEEQLDAEDAEAMSYAVAVITAARSGYTGTLHFDGNQNLAWHAVLAITTAALDAPDKAGGSSEELIRQAVRAANPPGGGSDVDR